MCQEQNVRQSSEKSCEGSIEVASGGPCQPAAGNSKAGDEIRWKAGFSDIDFPPVPFPTRRIFAVAGEDLLRALVRRHHERLRDSIVGHLFPFDAARFDEGVAKAADFVVEVAGGPDYYALAHGRVCMRTQHFPFTIDEQAREVWLAELLGAFADVAFPLDIREEYWNWVEAMSIRMINRRTMRAPPRRIPYRAL